MAALAASSLAICSTSRSCSASSSAFLFSASRCRWSLSCSWRSRSAFLRVASSDRLRSLALRASSDLSRFKRASRSLRSFSACASASSSSCARFRTSLGAGFLGARRVDEKSPAFSWSSRSLPTSPLVSCVSPISTSSGPSTSIVGRNGEAARRFVAGGGAARLNGSGGGDAVVPRDPDLAALSCALALRRASAAVLSLLTLVKISAAALSTLLLLTTARSGKCDIGEPYEMLYLVGIAALVIAAWSGAGDGLADTLVRRFGAMARREPIDPWESVALP